MYSLQYQVTTSACDSEGRLKLFSALQMMQDCSEMWIDSEPGVKHYFAEQNMAQLLASRQVEVVRVPKFKEKLTVTTSVYGMKPMFGFRNTFIYDAEGVPCYRTWSMGAFVDKSTGKLKRVDEATMASMTLEPQLDMTYGDRRIILPGIAEQYQYYHPNYNQRKLPPDYYDYRRTLYWNATAQPDENGQLQVNFYNNGKRTRMQVSVAGIGPDGQPLYY